MRLASIWLRGDRLTVAEAAKRLGYELESSFSRAFKRLVGVPPSAVRRTDASSQNVGAQPSEQVRSMPSRK